MKSFQVLLLACVAVSYIKAEAMDLEGLVKIAEECNEEVGATEDEVKAIFKHQPAKTTSEKCLRACILKKMELLDETAHMDEEKALVFVKGLAHGDPEKEKIGEEFVHACSGIEVPEDHCEAAETYALCIMKNMEGKEVHLLN